ncbi:MAG: tetratricopeptide repeat protein, partial [Candidatus Obscuribacterales bacterium]|nr:tetratricopeptide repeat protein [Candidatus Obscuribacterales bacterium]
ALGKQARVAGDFEGAAVEYGEALKIKDDPKVRIDLGDVLRVRDRIDDAINQYKVAAKSQGLDLDSQVKAWTSLGQCYQAKKDYPNSVAAYNEAIKLNRTDRETLEANRAVWAEAVQKDPVNAGNHVGLGQAYSYLGDFDQARAEYMQALVFDKTNQAAQQLLSTLPLAKKEFDRDKHVNNGVDLQSRKLYDAAIQEYTASLGIDTSLPPKERTSADIMVNLGSAFQAKEDYKTAIDWYTKALSIKPDYTAAQEGLKNSKERLVSKQLDDAASQGAIFFKSGNFNDALKCYQMLENANPKDAAAHFNVAATLQALKQIDLAIAEFKQAVSIAPDNKQYKEFLNKAMQDKADPIIDMAVKKHADKDYTSAIALYLQALQIVPDNQKVLFNLAGAYYSRQQFPEAQKLYEQLYQKDPKGQVDDLWLIGTILENAKRGNDALADYTKYVTEAPTGTYVAQAKSRIDALRKDPTDCIKIKTPEELAREKDADDSYKAAIKAQQEKRWDDASQLYMKTLSLRPNDPAVMFDYGTMFQAKKDLDSALKWFQSAFAGASNNPKFDKKTVAEMKDAIRATQEEKATPFVEEAQKRQSAGDFTTAIDNYKKALELVPDKARIWTNLGQAYQSIDDFTNARASYQKAVDLDPKNESTNYYLIGKIDENFGQGNDAIGHYRKYLLSNSTGPYANDANARLADLSKNITHCQKLPTSGDIKNQKIAEDEYNTGLAAQKGGNPGDALAHYQKASAAKPDESAYVEAIATCYQQLKNYDQALAAYDQAIAIATKNGRTKDVDIYVKQREDCAEEKAGPLVDKALAAYNAKDFKSAADLYGQALLIVPKLPAMHTSRATACQNADDFAGALDEYQKAYDLDPKTQKENLYFIGVLQENFGKGAQALATYRKYLTENPGGQYVAPCKQRVDMLSKDVTKTVKLPTTAERQSAEQVSGLYDEAIKLYNSGNYDAAVSKFQAILGISNDAVYHNALGSCYLALKKYDEAKTEFATASKLDPSNKQYKDNLNSILPLQIGPIVDDAVKKQTAGDLPGAIAGYRQALGIDPNNANVYTNLASALQSTEDFAGARSAFEKALTVDRKNSIGDLYF